ncbi:2-oxoacid:ferredoxin oxidoreductase subunit beta [Motiliproteus sp. SC1-56]|uniref:2-oxoacid:ferredoxin oxidoreductase subunit beta n=1 Tax=Motiliproteus sp. SC1-56 TaxID=2799565 RepID=UPI001A8F2B8C|nr:2-oxoacid:ferredoxin oxidoreductase subunit beta [Motiliproteus sp. SC1-56]
MTMTMTEQMLADEGCPAMTAKDYRSDVKPVWCPGCGDHGVLLALTKTLAELQLAPEKVSVVSGIGCSSRIPAYLNTYGFHGVHGRSLALATGLKVSRPDQTVLVAGGDGDGFSIGGNHFLHACRRNVDLTYIVMDNQLYGMTKGQASPTSAPDWEKGKLTPGGTGINPFHPLVVALASGANFIARVSGTNANGAVPILKEAIEHPGFSLVHVLSPCITYNREQLDWKKMVRPAPVEATNDPGRAARRLMTDDNLNLGVLYKGDRAPYQPDLRSRGVSVADLEAPFQV